MNFYERLLLNILVTILSFIVALGLSIIPYIFDMEMDVSIFICYVLVNIYNITFKKYY